MILALGLCSSSGAFLQRLRCLTVVIQPLFVSFSQLTEHVHLNRLFFSLLKSIYCLSYNQGFLKCNYLYRHLEVAATFTLLRHRVWTWQPP